MKLITSFRLIAIVLIGSVSMLMITQSAAADSLGKGGKGKVAAVGIDTILLIGDGGGPVLAEIAGGGFLAGDYVKVYLDEALIDHVVVSSEFLTADIPRRTPDGRILPVGFDFEGWRARSSP